MPAAASPSELLRRKQEQWEREKAESAIWFPFGSPGGGAPNRKPRSELSTPTQQTAPMLPQSPSSPKSPLPPTSTITSELSSAVTPQRQSTQMTTLPHHHPYAYLPPMPLQSPTMYGPPQQFVYAPSPHGHPIPVEVVQGPYGQMLRYPVAFPPTSPNLTATSQNASMSSSYTEQWTNRVPYWSSASPTDVAYTIEARTHLPPINCDQQNRKEILQSGADETLARSTLSSSFSSLNSCRQRVSSDDNDDKHRSTDLKNAYDAQMQDKKRREFERHEAEQRLEQQQIEDRRQLDQELQKRREEECAKGKRVVNEAPQSAVLERFKREAEQLKKAKLYRHVMQSPEAAPKYEKEVFGENCESAARVLSEVEALDRRKQLEREMFELCKSPSTPPSSDRSRSLPPKQYPTVQEYDDTPIRPALAENNTIRNFENVTSPQTKSLLQRGRSVRLNGSPRTHSTPRRSDSAENIDSVCAKPIQPSNRGPATAPVKSPDDSQTGHPKSLARARRTASRSSLVETPTRPRTTQNRILYSYDAEGDAEMVKSVDSGVGQTDNDNDNDRKGSIDSNESTDAHAVLEKLRIPSLPLPPSRTNLLKSKDFGGSAGLFEPVQTRNRNKMRFSNDAAAAPSGSDEIEVPFTPPTIITPPHSDGLESPSLPSAIRKLSCEDRFNFARLPSGKIRSRVNSTSKLGMNELDVSPPGQSAFAKKIAEQSTNSLGKSSQDISSPSSRRQFDTSSLSPGLTPSRLRLSYASLCGSENGDGDKSPSVSPKPFNSFLSRTPQYRSFNMKRNKESQQKILDQLAQLRAQLKDKQKRIGQTLYAEIDRSSSNQDSVAV